MKIKKGDKVSVTVYGQPMTGVVAAIGRGKIVWVKMDEDGSTRWFHLESLSRSSK